MNGFISTHFVFDFQVRFENKYNFVNSHHCIIVILFFGIKTIAD